MEGEEFGCLSRQPQDLTVRTFTLPFVRFAPSLFFPILNDQLDLTDLSCLLSIFALFVDFDYTISHRSRPQKQRLCNHSIIRMLVAYSRDMHVQPLAFLV